MNRIKMKLIAIALLLATAIWVVWRPQPTEAQRPRETMFVRGFVAATFQTPTQKVKDILLPNAKVFLVPFNDLTHPVTSGVTDLSGRFGLKTLKVGTYTICVEAEGFRRFCSPAEFRLTGLSKNVGTIRLPLAREKTAAAYGEVILGDGHHPRGFEPYLGVNSYATVELNIADSTKQKAYVNNLGEYIVASLPVGVDFKLRAKADKEELNRHLGKGGVRPGRIYEVDFQFPNRAPRIRLMSTAFGGKRVQIATPGSTVMLKTVAEDREGDKLLYRWMLPDGSVVGPTTDSEVKWTVPSRAGSFPVRVLVSDNRGGYASSSFIVTASTGNVPFGGSVVDQDGRAVRGAQVDVNGRVTNTNNAGRFRFEVPVSHKYVLTIRSLTATPAQPAYGIASYVYTGSILGGRWVLRPAQVFTNVDPTKAIKLQHKRTTKDCRGSLTSRIDWKNYLGKGLIEWQDGRGNIRSLPERAQRDRKSVDGVTRLLGRTNASLSQHFANMMKVKRSKNDSRNYPTYDKTPVVPCRDGIQVSIPANSLINTSTKLAPTGNVQISLSAIDLSIGDQMPGDYSAVDSSNREMSMESFGAGGIEVTSGTQRFNLRPGAIATVTIPVDGTQIAGGAALPPTIPFLYYDESKGTWIQDGTATLVGSGASAAYEKVVTHFSTMNADILKDGQSCVAVEVDPAAGFTLPLNVEVTLPPSVVNPSVIQVRTLAVDTLKSNVIYNLPNDTNIVLTPIISGTLPDGSSGNVPAGVFVVNTGGPQTSASNLPTPNGDGTYYAEDGGGTPTGPCGSRVTLRNLDAPSLSDGNEFLQGLYFESSNITEITAVNPTVAANIEQGAVDYYAQSDPRTLRGSFNEFKDKNDFGDPLDATEAEYDAQFANSGDLGFGRDMHCRRNVASDGAFDLACYVTNYGQPPEFLPDQEDADNAILGVDPDATVAMEYSRVENAEGVVDEFPDNDRAVKFYVYGTNPDGATIKKADLDGFGERPVPQLCQICHGGNTAQEPADALDPFGPKKGAFASRADIISMNANFLPFDLHLYNFPATKSKAAQQTAFKNLNRDIVREVAVANGAAGAPIVELIDTINPAAAAAQLENAVITNWDGATPTSDSHKFYRDVFARACRTCHVAQPYSAPPYTNKIDFQTGPFGIGVVQSRVCNDKIMPHAKRTNDIFWTSLNPNMPAFLQLYGQTFPDWSSVPDSQCGQFFQPGSTPESIFASKIYPILSTRCDGGGCHTAVGNATFAVGGTAADVYASITTAIANDGSSHYIVANDTVASIIFQRISNNPPPRMPFLGPNLFDATSDTDGDGVTDALEIQNWINAGAPGP